MPWKGDAGSGGRRQEGAGGSRCEVGGRPLEGAPEDERQTDRRAREREGEGGERTRPVALGKGPA